MRFVENIISGIIDHSKTLLYMFFVCIENTRVKKVIVGASPVNWKAGSGGRWELLRGHRCNSERSLGKEPAERRGLSTPGVEELGDGLLLPSGGLVVWVVGTAVVKKRNLDLCHFFDP